MLKINQLHAPDIGIKPLTVTLKKEEALDMMCRQKFSVYYLACCYDR